MIQSGLVNYHASLEADMTDIDSVQQHPDNANNGDVDEIIASIETNGMYHPITVQASTGYIVRGNHTWLACKMLGATQIPVKKIEVDDIHALRIMLADNKIASLALMDPALELPILEKIAEADSLIGTGYQEHDLEQLRHLADIAPADGQFAQWPTVCFQLPPKTVAAFHEFTSNAGGDREKFELLMRLAGWKPRE